MSKKTKDKDESKIQLGLTIKPTQDEVIQKVAALEPEYESYLEQLPPEKRQRIFNSVNRIQTGLHAVAPIMCLGAEKCPFIDRCPIPERDSKGELEFGPAENYPIGRACVLEKFYMEQKIIEYVGYLNVDPGNPVEMSIVNELALIDLYKNRALMVLSTGDKAGEGRDFLRTDVLGFNENGQAAEVVKLHPVNEVIGQLEKRREKWFDKLMETRKAKADWMIKVGGNHQESKILGEITRLREAILKLEGDEPLKIESSDEEEILLDD
jgi:hypothetical protein